MAERVLIIDDEENIRKMIRLKLVLKGIDSDVMEKLAQQK